MIDRDSPADIDGAAAYFKELQNRICDSLAGMDDRDRFIEDVWEQGSWKSGITRIVEGEGIFEKGGVNFSRVRGEELPQSATASRKNISGRSFQATGVSVVMHPRNPFVPTCHLNLRFIQIDDDADHPFWWFGGGYDLTPYYGIEEDCVHWHETARQACRFEGKSYYEKFKIQCDHYFVLKHRNEQRGVGGIFFDDFNEPGFVKSFALARNIGDSFLDAYMPIVEKRKDYEYSAEQQKFQRYRRGRYVEFNLVYDRGTWFGLQSGGRIESILMSLPPKVVWRYNWKPRPGSEEEKLLNYYLKPRDWLKC